jgi:hypothetical protein
MTQVEASFILFHSKEITVRMSMQLQWNSVKMFVFIFLIHSNAVLGQKPETILRQASVQTLLTIGVEKKTILYQPVQVQTDAQGNIYVLDIGDYRVKKFDSSGRQIAQWSRRGHGPDEFQAPARMFVASDGLVYVADVPNARITVFSSEGKYLRTVRTRGVGMMGIIVTDRRAIIMAGYGDSLLYEYDLDGALVRKWGEPLAPPPASSFLHQGTITTDGKDNLFLSFVFSSKIVAYSVGGHFLYTIDGPIVVANSQFRPRRVGGNLVTGMTGEEVFASWGIAADSTQLYSLFSGKSSKEHQNDAVNCELLHVYSKRDGVYRHTLRLPFSARSMHYDGRAFYFIVDEDQPVVKKCLLGLQR